jgi:NAD(P)-dependent dehydrogenase (short-subunit alcohol dehydrogenase family)
MVNLVHKWSCALDREKLRRLFDLGGRVVIMTGGIDVVVNNAANALAHPDEMVGPALLLTSDAGSFITGHVVFADGGMVPR